MAPSINSPTFTSKPTKSAELCAYWTAIVRMNVLVQAGIPRFPTLRPRSHYDKIDGDDCDNVTICRSHYDNADVIVVVTLSCRNRRRENRCRDYDYDSVKNDDKGVCEKANGK